MRRLFLTLAGVALAAAGPRLAASVADLKIGDQAPPFTLQGSNGRTYQLADYKGKQAVVIAWFAKAFTGP